MVQDLDTKIAKLEKKAKDFDDRILAIENKYLYIARSETKELYRDRAKANMKILELRKQKQNACKHEDYGIETVDLGKFYVENFCSNCKKPLGRDTKAHSNEVAMLEKGNV